jgi:type II secretory pathway component PulF
MTHSQQHEGAEQAALQSHLVKVLDQARAIAPALEAYAAEMPSGRQRRQLRAVCQIVERGDATDAASALQRLPDYWIPLLSAASFTNDPGRVLHEFIAESQQANELRRQRWLAFAYPFLVLSIALAVLAMLSIFVVPVFREIFDDFDLELPGLTMAVLSVSQWLARGGVALIAVLLLAIGVLLVNSQRAFPWSVTRWLSDRLAVPFGRRTAIARFARFTADLLEAGLGLPDALRIAGYCMHRHGLRAAAWQMAENVAHGRVDRDSPSERTLSSPVTYAVSQPMPDASRIRLLREISACHAEKSRLRLSWASGFIEPITICVVGITVGVMVLALFLPLVKLIEGLTH